jgi:NADH dehydrogenase FAD-containing subunit
MLPQQKRNITTNQLDSKKDSKLHDPLCDHSNELILFRYILTTSADRERVVILGSGWAGFTVARSLDASKFQAVVVSPRSYFAFTPLLASTAVGTLEFRTALEPVRSKRTKVDFFQGWADDVDFKNKTITIEEAVDDPTQGMALTTDRHAGETKEQREAEKKRDVEKGKIFDLTYDKLVVTVGCYSQTFETPGVREHAHFLKDVGDARKIRNRLLACFEGAALPTTSDEMRRQLLNFAVVGGGPTGIEFSAELHDLINEDLAKIYPELIPYHKITVYDVAEKVLPMFDEKLASYAMKKFKREGIEIKTSHHVEELRPGAPAERSASDDSKDYHLYTLKVKEEGEIGVGMCVWSKSPNNSLNSHQVRLYRLTFLSQQVQD